VEDQQVQQVEDQAVLIVEARGADFLMLFMLEIQGEQQV
jgi:hypothetical protein